MQNNQRGFFIETQCMPILLLSRAQLSYSGRVLLSLTCWYCVKTNEHRI